MTQVQVAVISMSLERAKVGFFHWWAQWRSSALLYIIFSSGKMGKYSKYLKVEQNTLNTSGHSWSALKERGGQIEGKNNMGKSARFTQGNWDLFW